ncbi:MAG: MmcQ/YjbR family DNA-binding protein [Pseudomonadota bacterium]
MNAAEVRSFCATLRGATEIVQWGDNHVFKVGGKMFAVTGDAADARYSFKVDDDRFLELTGIPGIIPAPYLARAKWVQVSPAECPLSAAELEALLRDAYGIILQRLPKYLRRELSGEA